jgi:hypothetical protein
MECKNCKKCGSLKKLSDFVKNKSSKDGYRNECKPCYNKRLKDYRTNNPEWRKKATDAQKSYRLKNPHKQKEYQGRYKERLNYWAKKNRSSDLVKLKETLRSRLNSAIRGKGYSKNTKTADTLGCTWEELKLHLESQFKDGMSWSNRSEWHIDHIIPLASATTEEEVYKLNHYTNLQPLWAEDNLKKGAKY